MKNRNEAYSLSDSVLTTTTTSPISNFTSGHPYTHTYANYNPNASNTNENTNTSSSAAAANTTTTVNGWDRRAAKLSFRQFSQLFSTRTINIKGSRRIKNEHSVNSSPSPSPSPVSNSTITINSSPGIKTSENSRPSSPQSPSGQYRVVHGVGGKSLFFNQYWRRRRTIGGDSSSHLNSFSSDKINFDSFDASTNSVSDRSGFVILGSESESELDIGKGKGKEEQGKNNTSDDKNVVVCNCYCNYKYNNCECHCDTESDSCSDEKHSHEENNRSSKNKNSKKDERCCCDYSIVKEKLKAQHLKQQQEEQEKEKEKEKNYSDDSNSISNSNHHSHNPLNNFCHSLWNRKVKKEDNKLIQNIFRNYFKSSKKNKNIQKQEQEQEEEELQQLKNHEPENNPENVILNQNHANCHCHCFKCACFNLNSHYGRNNIDINGDSLEIESELELNCDNNTCNSNSNINSTDNSNKCVDVNVDAVVDIDIQPQQQPQCQFHSASGDDKNNKYESSQKNNSNPLLVGVGDSGSQELNLNINLNLTVNSNNSNSKQNQYNNKSVKYLNEKSRKNEAIYSRKRLVLRSQSENADPEFIYSSSVNTNTNDCNLIKSEKLKRKEQLKFFNSYHSTTDLSSSVSESLNGQQKHGQNKKKHYYSESESPWPLKKFNEDYHDFYIERKRRNESKEVDQKQFDSEIEIENQDPNQTQKLIVTTNNNNKTNSILNVSGGGKLKSKPKIIIKDKDSDVIVENNKTEKSGKPLSVSFDPEIDKTMETKKEKMFKSSGSNVSVKSDSEDEKHVFHSGDDETSSTYSTAEEDHDNDNDNEQDLGLESDVDRRALSVSTMSNSSAYATPDASMSASKYNLFSFESRVNSSPDILEESEKELNLPSANMDSMSNSNQQSKRDSQTTESLRKLSEISQSSSQPNVMLSRPNQFGQFPVRKKSRVELMLEENEPITSASLQCVFDVFKDSNISRSDCEILLDSLANAQAREDFQWALHQLGGFNAILFLFARVVEICPEDQVQSKGLSLVLTQLRNHSRLTDGPAHRQYHLIRFVLNSEKCVLGFKTFINIMNFSLSASGLKLIDYQLLDTCLLSCWKSLTRVRCSESDAPTGRKTLFECLLTIILDLLEERNSHRDLNVALLKANRFSETLLSICYHIIVDHDENISSRSPSPHPNSNSNQNQNPNPNLNANTKIQPPSASASSDLSNLLSVSESESESASNSNNIPLNQPLNLLDGLRLASLVKSILAELMAPPDAYVAVTLVKYGLCPLLPKELPPLPRREDAYFIHQKHNMSPAALLNLNNLNSVKEAEEAQEGKEKENTNTNINSVNKNLPHSQIPIPNDKSETATETENEDEDDSKEEMDVPEILGVDNSSKTSHLNISRSSSPDGSSSASASHGAGAGTGTGSGENGVHSSGSGFGFGLMSASGEFSSTFQESLLEGVMSILLNALSILPDAAFHSVLGPHLNSYIFIAYASHSSIPLKKLALKLLSAYLTRVKPPVLLEFLKSKGFYLSSLYIQGNPEVSALIVNICHGFGPLSYPLLISLLYSNTVVNSVLEWILSGDEEERKGPSITIPSLMSMGLFNSIFNIQNSSLNGSLQKPLQNLLSIVTRFCAISSKEEPWKCALVPAVESAYGYSTLVPKIVMESVEFLRKNRGENFLQSYHQYQFSNPNFNVNSNVNNNYNNNNNYRKGSTNKKVEVLKKSDSNVRLMWLLERSAAGVKMGTQFDRWLLNIFTLHIMEIEEEEETEYWNHFVKKNKKKLNQLMGIFLCRVFSCTKDNMDFKHHTIRVLLTFCPHLTQWLPKVIKYDEQIERCLTAFIRIFLSTAGQVQKKHDSTMRTAPSFHSLISDQGGNLTLTLQMQNQNQNENQQRSRSISRQRGSVDSQSQKTEPDDDIGDIESFDNLETEGGNEQEQQQGKISQGQKQPSDQTQVQMSDKTMREKFEAVLVDAGILSPTSSFSTFSADFKNFKILLETPTSAGGVSPIELRQCLSMLEKMRVPFSLGSSLNNNLSSINNKYDGTYYHSPSLQHPLSNSYNQSHSQIQHNDRGKPGPWNCVYFDGVFEAVNKYAMEMLINVARARTQQEVEVARRICVQDADVDAVKQWVNIREQLVHPKASWYFPDAYPSFFTLDQSEGPGRIRARIKKEHLKVHNRFVLSKYRKSGSQPEPLEYLFLSHSAELLKIPLILNEIQYMRFCTRIIPGEELSGEIILTSDHLTFIAEHANVANENVEVRKTAIKYLMKRRYTLEDRAVEIFLECRSFLFVFKTKKDREEFVSLLGLKPSSTGNVASASGSGATQFHSVNSTLLETSMTSMTSQWLKGQLSNFEYLMYLNTAAGRTYCDLMQYPVFPFVLSKYDSPTLDLTNPQSYRDLKKPMAIQDASKEEHFISTYNYLKRECDSAPFHYGSHYSNSGIVLHFLVRLPPYTQHFLTYQDGSFDIPDRSFHSMETTWRLASKESNTDFKEAIPEFFYLPEFLQNLQHFDLGVRQSGHRVDDVVLPPWAKGNARLFTLINRQALESNHVRKFLCDWIDLIFGYKQGGKAALQALNVFHPSTYEGFEVDGNGDELLIRARKAMVSTYGQTPKQLFAYPHPRPAILSEEKCDMEVLDTVWGIKWGVFLGSPACPDLEVIHTREYQESIRLFETDSRVVFWPEQTLILGDNVVGSWNDKSIRVKQTIVFNSIGDDITVCRGTSGSSIWVGHQSGRISVLKMSPKLDKVLEKVELVGHYKPIKHIHVNSEFSMAISCAGENYAIQWDVNKYPKIAFHNTIECSEAIDDIYSSSSTGDVVLLNKQYNRVTLATINAFIVGAIEPDERVHSVCLSTLDPGRNINVIAVGCDYGIIKFYSTWDMKFLNQIKVLPLATLPIQSVRYNKDGRRLYSLAQTEEGGAVTVVLQIEKRR